MEKHLGYRVINYKNFEEKVRKSRGTEEEPFEGEIPFFDVFNSISDYLVDEHKKGNRSVWLIDGSLLPNISDGITTFYNSFYLNMIGTITVTCDKQSVISRMKKKLEIEEISEEQMEEIANLENKYENDLYAARVKDGLQFYQFSTEVSEETLISEIKETFAPKVILVNHEKRLTVDTTCANLAIKYNFLYISVYQTIKQHIENNTEYGRKL